MSAERREGPAGFLRSSLRLGWTLSVLGAQETARLISRAAADLGPTDQPMAKNRARTPGPTLALDTVAVSAESNLSAPAREIYRAVERWQQDTLDLLFGGTEIPLRASGRRMARTLMVDGGAGGSRRVLASLAPFAGSHEPELRRLADLLEAFELFVRGTDPGTGDPRAEAERLLRTETEPFRCLWRLEGLGWARAEAAWQDGELDEDRLHLEADAVPEAALMPLATGMGLSLARRLIAPPGSPAANLERVGRLCHEHAPTGCGLMVFEAAGLVARQLAPTRLDALARAAEQLGENHAAAFWHGAGRALYLSPALLRPGGAARAIDLASSLPEPVARGNALAGTLWAATLVHLRHPAVLDRVLDTEILGRCLDSAEPALRHGLEGALTVWYHFVMARSLAPSHEPLLWALGEHYADAAVWPLVEQAMAGAEARATRLRLGESTWDAAYHWLPAEAS